MSLRNVLITGGAGFLGINLLRHLHDHDYKLSAIDLEPIADADALSFTQAAQGDIRDAAAIDQAVVGQDVIVHAAAALPRYSERDIYTTEVEGTRRVLEAARRRGVRRVIYISSTAVYGIPGDAALTEEAATDGIGPYGKAKVEAEALAASYRSNDLAVTILRPKTFVGPERLGVFDILFDWSLSGHNFPVLGSGTNRYQLLHVDDLCELIRLCIEQPADAVNDTFNVGAERFRAVREEYQGVLDAAGHGKRVVSVPKAPAIFGLWLLSVTGLSPIYPWVYRTASHDSAVSIEKAKQRLGFRPSYSNDDALLANFHWYRDNLDRIRALAGGTSHRTPWPQGALRIVKKFF